MSNPIPKAMVMIFLAGGASAHADNGQQPALPATDPGMCEALANMPSAPMTVEACKAMLKLTEDDPTAHRPGDESMTCADIFTELQVATGDLRISTEEVARRQKTIDDMQTLNQRHGTKAAAALAPNVAAMQAIGVVAPFVPSAVTEPAIIAQQAQIQAKGKVAANAYSAEARKLTGESADIAASTMGNPRTRRLSQLAVQRDCKEPSS